MIVDDDIDLSQLANATDADLDNFNLGEDLPQIVGIIDDRPPDLIAIEDYKASQKWKMIGNNETKETYSGKDRLTETYRSLKRHINELSPKRSNKTPDATPPRRSKQSPDASPPRRMNRNHDSSPPRRSKKSPDASPPRRINRNKDVTPPRRSKQSQDASPPRRMIRNKDVSPKKYANRSSDASPPRRSNKNHDSSPFRHSKRQSRSPHRSRDHRESSYKPSIEHSKKNNVNDSPPPTHKKMSKTLEGKIAGLQDAKALREENELFRKRENQMFKKMLEGQKHEGMNTKLQYKYKSDLLKKSTPHHHSNHKQDTV